MSVRLFSCNNLPPTRFLRETYWWDTILLWVTRHRAQPVGCKWDHLPDHCSITSNFSCLAVVSHGALAQYWSDCKDFCASQYFTPKWQTFAGTILTPKYSYSSSFPPVNLKSSLGTIRIIFLCDIHLSYLNFDEIREFLTWEFWGCKYRRICL